MQTRNGLPGTELPVLLFVFVTVERITFLMDGMIEC